MTTKIIPDSDRMETHEISGTLLKPKTVILYSGDHAFSMVADHGDFAVFTHLGASRFIAHLDAVSVILNAEQPRLDLQRDERMRNIYMHSKPSLEFTPASHQERE